MDPLVASATALATHALYGKAIWALLIIAGTMLIGRFFCGWICPPGTLNHFFSSYKPERNGMKRVGSNHYQKWMAIKYYLLFALIAMSFFTSLQTGILDPIPFLVRSLSTSILPAISFGLRSTLDFLYGTNIESFQWLADTGYGIFGSNILSFKPQYYHFELL